jgi:hypothetical protein
MARPYPAATGGMVVLDAPPAAPAALSTPASPTSNLRPSSAGIYHRGPYSIRCSDTDTRVGNCALEDRLSNRGSGSAHRVVPDDLGTNWKDEITSSSNRIKEK